MVGVSSGATAETDQQQNYEDRCELLFHGALASMPNYRDPKHIGHVVNFEKRKE